MVNGSRYYRALESVSIASGLSSALTIYPCQIRVHQTLTVLKFNFLQLGRRSGGRPQRTVFPRRLPVNTVIQTTLAGIEPTNFRLLVRRAVWLPRPPVYGRSRGPATPPLPYCRWLSVVHGCSPSVIGPSLLLLLLLGTVCLNMSRLRYSFRGRLGALLFRRSFPRLSPQHLQCLRTDSLPFFGHLNRSFFTYFYLPFTTIHT